MGKWFRRGCCAIATGAMAFGATAAWADPQIVVSRRDCARLVAHEPTDDVAYTPGIDVRGRWVAPPEVDDQRRLDLPDTIVIPITVDLEERLGIGEDGRFEAEAHIGVVAVREGKAYFNGELLDDEAAAAVRAACQEAFGGAGSDR